MVINSGNSGGFPLRLWGMYKRSEPMGRLHSVQKHMANVYLPLQFKEVEMFREHTTVADPGFSKWGGTVLSQMGGRTSCFQVKSA